MTVPDTFKFRGKITLQSSPTSVVKKRESKCKILRYLPQISYSLESSFSLHAFISFCF
ncbi:unnamed protein product [Tenebrio molitor]|nr:unnamed protein product [Tenebrio molitor]